MSETHPDETWRDIDGFPGYQVSDLGNVRSCRRCGPAKERLSPTWRLLRGYKTKYGYVAVTLGRTGERARRAMVHRLVLEAFVGPCPDGMLARHVQTNDRVDNRLVNLAWGTPQENADDMLLHGSRGYGGPPPSGITSFRLKPDDRQYLEDLIAHLSAAIGGIPVMWQDVVRLALRKLWEERCGKPREKKR